MIIKVASYRLQAAGCKLKPRSYNAIVTETNKTPLGVT
jgi:hypothetical protein